MTPEETKRSVCRDCGGASICEQDRIRSQCKDCGGRKFCEHGRLKCKDWEGGSILWAIIII